MRAVVQRVTQASVEIEHKRKAEIGQGLLILLGIEIQDTSEDGIWLARKILGLRIFADSDNKMNHSVCDIRGEILVVSQFTLFASTKKGNRPSYIRAAPPEIAISLYEGFLTTLRSNSELNVTTGVFAADMKISMVNDGPVTIVLDSKQRE
jgi:D-tyrosyl-tRNA(Tyr) deacylase